MKGFSHRVEGRGEPIVLLNGGLMTLSSWEDQIMPRDRPAAMAAAIPDVRVELVEGAGHALVGEQPDHFSSLCLALVRGVVRTLSSGPDGPTESPAIL